MATQSLEFNATSGLTLSAKLFARGGNTVIATTSSVTEKSNDKNRYVAVFTDVAAGDYRLNAFVGAAGGFANELYTLTLTTATFQPWAEHSAGSGGGGGGSTVVSVLPGRDRSVPAADAGQIVVYANEIITIARAVVDGNGEPMDLSGFTNLQFVVQDARGVDLAVVAHADITISGVDNDSYSFINPSAMSAKLGVFDYSLNQVGGARICGGKWIVRRRALSD